MIEITVSKDNYNALIAAPPGEEVLVYTKERGEPLNIAAQLYKCANVEKPVELTIEDIEGMLGRRIKIVGGKRND